MTSFTTLYYTVFINIGGAVEVDFEDVEMLLRTLEGRLQPFLFTKEIDVKLCESKESDFRERFVAIYRDGQRKTLEDVIHVLNSMLGKNIEEEE